VTNKHAQYQIAVVTSILVVTALTIGGVRIANQSRSSKANHLFEWHRLHVDVGPDFTLASSDTLLRATRRLPTSPVSPDLLIFKWKVSSDAQDFEKATRDCANDSRCDLESDSVAGIVYDCMIYKHGSLATSTLTNTSICIVPNTRIESYYRCLNLACEQFRSVVRSTFASLGPPAHSDDSTGDSNSTRSR
jgi:hypothetical protein